MDEKKQWVRSLILTVLLLLPAGLAVWADQPRAGVLAALAAMLNLTVALSHGRSAALIMCLVFPIAATGAAYLQGLDWWYRLLFLTGLMIVQGWITFRGFINAGRQILFIALLFSFQPAPPSDQLPALGITLLVGAAYGWLLFVVLVKKPALKVHPPKARSSIHYSFWLILLTVAVFVISHYYNLPHLEWLLIPLVMDLSPYVDLTQSKSIGRLSGALGGSLLALLLFLTVPQTWITGVLIALLFLTLHFSSQGFGKMILFLTPLVILSAAVTSGEPAESITLYRLVYSFAIFLIVAAILQLYTSWALDSEPAAE